MHPNESLREKVADLSAFGLEIWKVHVDALYEQNKNARSMSNGMFDRLANNMAEDGRLESMPFCFRNERDQFEIISGHHRVRGARKAEITEIYILLEPKPLTRDEVISKQLSHNALSGRDDAALMAELYNEIGSVMSRLKTGLDPKELAMLDEEPLSATNIGLRYDSKAMVFLFLPSQYDAVQEAIRISGLPGGDEDDEILIGEIDQYERLQDAMRSVGRHENIRNASAVFVKIADIVRDHYSQKELEDASAQEITE
jgi:hypothetical protein